MSRCVTSSIPKKLSIAAAVIFYCSGCLERSVELPGCWTLSNLRQGMHFDGEFVIIASKGIRHLMHPVSCEGTSVIANIPNNVLGYDPDKEEDETVSVFYIVKAKGVVDGEAEGRPMVTLNRVTDVRRHNPSWLRTF